MSISQSELIARRGEILAELFLQDLKPFFIARNVSNDLGIDFFAGFLNPRGGFNLVAIEVKATVRPVQGRYQLPRRTYDMLSNSNIPGILLVVDVKENRLYYHELRPMELDVKQKYVTVEVMEASHADQLSLIERLSA